MLFLFIGTLPTVLIGLGFKDFLGGLFENPKAVSGALLFTGMVLFTSVFFNEKAGSRTYLQGLLIGCAQAIAIIPGISRSGMTICMGLFLGLRPHEAAQISFLLAIPAISGATLLTAFEMEGPFPMPITVAMVAFISSFIMGIIALKWLLGWLEQGKFYYFGFYCFGTGLITLVI